MFYNIILEVKNLFRTAEITILRLVLKQTCRSNVSAIIPEQYYKINRFYPFMDHVVQELKTRFASYAHIIENLSI